MKVLLLGAGASKSAGYPLATELMDAVEREAASSRELMLRDAWKEWDRVRRGMSGSLGFLVRNPNPEVVLSLLDIFEIGIAAADERERLEMIRKVSQGDRNAPASYEIYLNSPDREEIEAGIRARARLLHCVWSYLAWKHHDDSLPEGRQRREYLRRLLGWFGQGDIVVTLNWDTTIERTLAEDGRWLPVDGYGFAKDLLRDDPASGAALAPNLSRPSEVLVLKPHGSFGWHSRDDFPLYFDQASFLEEFDFSEGSSPLRLFDPLAPAVGPPADPAVLYPSYLKRVRSNELLQVWRRLNSSVQTALEIEVYGYSLPDADTALRATLLPLRDRLESGNVVVRVHDPSPSTQRRWRLLLGDRAQIDGEALG